MWTTHWLFVAAAFTSPVFARECETQTVAALSASDRATLDAGRQVLREERIATSAWPRVTVLQFIAATPQEAAAVFADYARHASYMPGLKRSTIAHRLGPLVTEVDYVLEVPIFADEDYTVRDSVSSTEDGAAYRVDWTKVRARSTKGIVGHAVFERYENARTGAAGTLVTYVNLVSPGQLLAGPLKGRALNQVRETVTALARQIEGERASERELLRQQVDSLLNALAGRVPPPPGDASGKPATRP